MDILVVRHLSLNEMFHDCDVPNYSFAKLTQGQEDLRTSGCVSELNGKQGVSYVLSGRWSRERVTIRPGFGLDVWNYCTYTRTLNSQLQIIHNYR